MLPMVPVGAGSAVAIGEDVAAVVVVAPGDDAAGDDAVGDDAVGDDAAGDDDDRPRQATSPPARTTHAPIPR
jgi:hypothetical protein